MTQDDAGDGFRDWVRGRISLAKRLNRGGCGGSYGDAMLVLSALLSGRAANLWPGKGKDRRRFVEVWSTLSDPGLTPNLIRVPLLLADLKDAEERDLIEKVRGTNLEALAPHNDSLVLTGERVDLPGEELEALDTRLTAKRLRRFSYGSVFYEHVRSGHTHDYHTTDSASPFPRACTGQLCEHAQAIRPLHLPPHPLRRRLGGRGREVGLGFFRRLGPRATSCGPADLVD